MTPGLVSLPESLFRRIIRLTCFLRQMGILKEFGRQLLVAARQLDICNLLDAAAQALAGAAV